MLSEASGLSRPGGHGANIRPSSCLRTAAVPEPEEEGKSLQRGIWLRAPCTCIPMHTHTRARAHTNTHKHTHAALCHSVIHRSKNNEYLKAVFLSLTICLFLWQLRMDTINSTPLPARRARHCAVRAVKAPTRGCTHSTPLSSSGQPERGCGFWPMTGHKAEWNVRKQGCG